MTQKQQIEDVAQHNATLMACLRLARAYGLSWEETLEIAVLRLVEGNNRYLDMVVAIQADRPAPALILNTGTDKFGNPR